MIKGGEFHADTKPLKRCITLSLGGSLGVLLPEPREAS